MTHDFLSDKNGYIYIIASKRGIPCNIGVSRNYPTGKLMAMESGNPYPLGIWFAKRFTEPSVLYKILCLHFREERLNGDWFGVTARMMARALQVANSWNNMGPDIILAHMRHDPDILTHALSESGEPLIGTDWRKNLTPEQLAEAEEEDAALTRAWLKENKNQG